MNKVINILRIAWLKHKANRIAKETCRQHFVVVFGGKARIISKPEFKQMRQRGLFPQEFTAEGLKKIALYHTPNRAQLNQQQNRI